MMMVRPRGRAIARGGCLTGAALSLLLAFVAPGAGAQESDEAPVLPDAFAASASSSAITISMLTPAIVPVDDLFTYGIAEGRGIYDSSSQEARASLFFPGNGFVKGPGLACGEFFGPNIPPEGEPIFGPIVDACLAYHFPLAVFADGLTPDQETEGYTSVGEPSDPVSFDANGARAHAGLDATWTDAQVNDFRLTGAPSVGNLDQLLGLAGLEPTNASLITIDGATATTDQRIVDGGTLVSDARATVNGL